ncbi:OmpA family protein [Pseudoalteromonas sp. T1lg65]|uniref:OmpA family protein n=1 Tax=Pseudoalteromonas sp. T1lg65 TaxID=2077101 RepID=UPI003F78F3BA
MKIKTLSLLVAMASVAGAHASEPTEGFHVGVFGERYEAEWQNVRDFAGLNVEDSTSWGAELGYRFNKSWTGRFEYADMDFDLSGISNGSLDGKRFGLDALYHFDGGPFYGIAGVKKMDLDVISDNTFVNLGAGYRHYFTENFFVNAEAAVYQGLEASYTDVGGKLGLNYSFGSAAKTAPVEAAPAPAVKKAPQDSDKDGIMDGEDKCANTPISDAVDASGCTLYEMKEESVTLLVRFAHDGSKVSKQYMDDISEVARFLKAHTASDVVLEGHASAVGDAEYNQGLSERRAKAVAKQLMEKGIDASRITTIGFGEERLKNTANTLEAHAENRRVEAQAIASEKVKVKRK